MYCSTEQCQFFKNGDGTTVLKSEDAWHTQKRIEVGNLPNLGNEFNIFVPIYYTKNQPLPKRIVLAFTDNYGPGGRLRVSSVYRIFGPPVGATIFSPLTVINGLAASPGFDYKYLNGTGGWGVGEKIQGYLGL